MKKRIFVLLLLASLTLTALASAQTLITAQGTATLTAEPDIAVISGGINARAKTLGEAQQQVNAATEAVTAKLLELGIAEEDIVTSYYNFYPVYEYDEMADESRIRGYQANHQLSITLRDVSRLDDVVLAATGAGMEEVNQIAFDIADRHALYMQALGLAVTAAREKAQALAAAEGKTLGKATSLTELSSGDVGVYANAEMSMDKGLAARASSTSIRSGSVSVTVSVTAAYEAE